MRMTTMVTLFVLLVCVALIVWMGSRYSQLQALAHDRLGEYKASLRRAAQESINASQCANLPMALISSAKAVALVGDVVDRFGTQNAHEHLHIDVEHLHGVFRQQLDTILAAVFEKCPDTVPNHPYTHVAGWENISDDQRHADVAEEDDADDDVGTDEMFRAEHRVYSDDDEPSAELVRGMQRRQR